MTQEQLQTILIFAARYAHNRKTGAAYAVCKAIEAEWRNLDNHTQYKLKSESHEATCNDDDWQIIRRLPISQIGTYRQARFDDAEGGDSETVVTMP